MGGNSKPLKDIIFVIRHLTCADHEERPVNQQIIHFDSQRDGECLLFHRGSAVLRRKRDHHVVAQIHAPAIIGLNSTVGTEPWQHYYLQATSQLTLERIGALYLHEVISKYSLWGPVCRILSWNINQLCHTTLRLNQSATAESGK
ncbi:hypothetical protein RIN58_01245 [Siccibacter colletis]|uniref:hypothetical protein n=1 Tax=Siccibacter colletis TaxID=1505757 RepID=UPI0028BE4B00|nr:hypothetical protein [Siccibacter colletis]WNN48779.1 hypothetical protein RIN58_01245 [Siccibacter colletis]